MHFTNIKKYIKPIYSMGVRILVPLCLPFVSKKVDIVPIKEARKILEQYSPDSHGTIDANNKITPDYDLHIIVPCYNVEKYVIKCLKSIFSQKTKYSFFVSIINDGSTDNTLPLIKNYLATLPAKQQTYFELINQKNKGLSGARNTGLSHIRGKYIMFVDSDDLLSENAIDNLLSIAYNKKIEIVVGAHVNIDMRGEMLFKSKPRFHGFACGKIFKSEIFRNLKFPEGYWFEDTMIACYIYPKYKQKYLIEDIVYQYRTNPNGIMSSSKRQIKSIDAFYLYTYLFDRMYKDKILYDLENIKTILNHIALAYTRTVHLQESIKKAGFILFVGILSSYDFFNNTKGIKGMPWKYRKMYQALSSNDFGTYAFLSKYWRFI